MRFNAIVTAAVMPAVFFGATGIKSVSTSSQNNQKPKTMLGIEKLKAGILLAVAFANQAHEAAADGFKPADIFSFIDEAMQVQGVLASADEMKAELNDLDLNERGEIIAAVAEKLDVGNEKAEAVTLAGLDWLAATQNLIKNIAA